MRVRRDGVPAAAGDRHAVGLHGRGRVRAVHVPGRGRRAVGRPASRRWNRSEALPCGLAARDVLRLEMGYPLYGQDLFESVTALEAGLSWAVSFDKGEFRGRDSLVRQREAGLPSRLVGLRMHERRHIPRAHYPVFRGDQLIGEVTTGTFSPLLQTGIGLAYVWPADVTSCGRHGRGRHPGPQGIGGGGPAALRGSEPPLIGGSARPALPGGRVDEVGDRRSSEGRATDQPIEQAARPRPLRRHGDHDVQPRRRDADLVARARSRAPRRSTPIASTRPAPGTCPRHALRSRRGTAPPT